MTKSVGTLQKSEIFSFMPCDRGRSVRQRSTSGWMPISRSSFTECCVGLVLSSPAAPIHGTSVTCTLMAFWAHLQLELADGLEEGQRLDVADGAADLDDGHVGALGGLSDARLDLVGDVRNHLHRRAEVLAAALLGDDRLVDAPVVKLLARVSARW
jgi:hypothetical protein